MSPRYSGHQWSERVMDVTRWGPRLCHKEGLGAGHHGHAKHHGATTVVSPCDGVMTAAQVSWYLKWSTWSTADGGSHKARKVRHRRAPACEIINPVSGRLGSCPVLSDLTRYSADSLDPACFTRFAAISQKSGLKIKRFWTLFNWIIHH